MKTVIINGLSLGYAKNITGVQRACHELIYRLDELLENEDEMDVRYIYNIDAANIVIKPDELKNITPVPKVSDGKKFWKNRVMRKYIRQERALLCCLSLETILLKNQITCIYDVRAVTTKFDPLKFRIKYRMFMFFQRINSQLILTDSEYQRNEIAKYLKIKKSKTRKIYMGYEHILGVEPDYKIFEKHPELKGKEFYYTLGSLAPHKNFSWVAEVAKRNPDSVFAIAGGKDLEMWKDNVEVKGVKNLIFLGYVTDEESKALIEKCTAFLYPSKYEGFGIPPLEALACGAKIIISDATCLPEVYEDCAVYFSPDEYDIDLKGAVNTSVADPAKIFEKCSWDKSAKDLLEVIRNAK